MKCPDALCFALRQFPVRDTNLGIAHHPVSLYMHNDALLYSFLRGQEEIYSSRWVSFSSYRQGCVRISALQAYMVKYLF